MKSEPDPELERLLAEEEEIERVTRVLLAATEPPDTYGAWSEYRYAARHGGTYAHLHPVIQAALFNDAGPLPLSFITFWNSYSHFLKMWESNVGGKQWITRQYVLRPKTWQYPLTNSRWF